MVLKSGGLVLGGLAAGLLIGRLPLWGEGANDGPAAPVLQPAAPAPSVARADWAQEAKTGAQRAVLEHVRSEDTALEEATSGTVTLYGPDGEYPCDPACVAALADDFLAGTLTEDGASDVYTAMQPVMGVIAADPARRRRFLAVLGETTFDWDQAGGVRQQVAMNLVTSYGLPDDLAEDIQRVMERSADPMTRGFALNVAQMRDDPAVATRAVERALMREQEPRALGLVLGNTIGLREPLSASALSAVRSLADAHDDEAVRGTAYYALVNGAEPSERTRAALIERGLSDPAPMIRLAAVSAATEASMTPPAEAEIAAYRGIATAVANDADADAELRMHALSLLTWGALAEDDGGGGYGPFDY